MHVAARRKLPRYRFPLVVRCVPGGHVAMLTTPACASRLELYSAALEPLWSTAIDVYVIGMCWHRDRFWVFDFTGMSAFEPLTGKRIDRIALPVPEGMRVGGFVPMADGFIVALEHAYGQPAVEPVLMRVNASGEVEWMTTLAEGRLRSSSVHDGSGPVLIAVSGRTWQCHQFSAPVGVVSGNAMLVVYGDGVLQMGYVVSLQDGALRYFTRIGQILDVAALGGGDFLVGYRDIATGEPPSLSTYHYGRTGRILNQWTSAGLYVVNGDDIRMIENHCADRPMHITQLDGGGRTTRGDWLEGRGMSRPSICSDGLVRFGSYGLIYAVNGLRVVNHLAVSDAHREIYPFKMDMMGNSLASCWIRPLEPGHEAELVRVAWN